jgi:hypothetical protein
MDEAYAGLDDEPVATGVRAGGKGVERTKELWRQMNRGRRHEQGPP